MLWEQLEAILPEVEKPARYTGNEINAVRKNLDSVDVSVVLAFPDVYEIGTSYLGFQILYDIINRLPGAQAERVFAPWPDMESKMRDNNIPLFGLETKRPLAAFDIVGFTLQYELGYTNILNMLNLADIPIWTRERTGLPFIIAGGPGAYNPEPLSGFVDAFVLGEGEELIAEVIELVRQAKSSDWSREQTLVRLAAIGGIYVPEFYHPQFDQAGAYIGTIPINDLVPSRPRKRIVNDFAEFPLPENVIVPLVQPVHDRTSIEICRGCARGCRFCQAGMIYRPVRERNSNLLARQGQQLLAKTGSGELSLSSLSSADYTEIEELISRFMKPGISVALPSLRVDSYSVNLAKLTGAQRKSGLTLAPEAGTQRLRNVINKNVTEDDILTAVKSAFSNGWTTVKLYFMIGLPTETRDDVLGIAALVAKIQTLYREAGGAKGRLRINLGVSTFVPKPHTPFQWEPLLEKEEVEYRQDLLRKQLPAKNIKIQTTGWEESFLEATLARGDRRLANAIFTAWQLGCRFDAWREHFRPDLWEQAFMSNGLNPRKLVCNRMPLAQKLPWDHIDSGIRKQFLAREAERAEAAEQTADCTFFDCHGCGICTAYSLKPWSRGERTCD
ncbi:MAG: TIGR03960 family B12-binding radical SAM protein [Firmicutes bacterium]|nr:TIGR03960 family B12-binding radical SAM protein [Bacillota bacterium]